MIEIIPTIIAQDFNQLKEKIKKIEPYVEWVQLDVMDGQFVDNSTWQNPEELKELETDLNLEAHLMIKNPEEVIENWIDSGIKRIIFHYESTDQYQEILNKIKKAGLETGIAINPKTPIEVVEKFIPQLDLILVMTVNPGKGGQELISDTLVKVKRLQDLYPNKKIQVDGGVNLENVKELINTGADILAVGSTIFNSQDIEEIINQLKNASKKKTTKKDITLNDLAIMVKLGFDGVDKRFDGVDKRFDKIEKQVGDNKVQLESISEKFSSLDRRMMYIEDRLTEIVKENKKEFNKVKKILSELKKQKEVSEKQLLILEKRIEKLELKVI